MSSHGASDNSMQKTMIIVGIALCLLTITIVITARTLSSGSNDEFDQLLQNAKVARIQPVAQVRTEAPVVEDVAAAMLSGEDVANGVCAGCHISGAGGAPLFSDTAEWERRSAVGLEALVASVINGKGAMPARGGSNYSDDEIARGVEFMTGLGNGGAIPADSGAASSEEAQPESTEATQIVESAAAVTTTVAKVDEASGGGVIAALTPRIQTTVDEGVCAGCHTAGVAGAPKFGDTAKWASLAEKGFAALAQTVTSGKGAMPPRGGSDLTDDELLIAVEYMVQKSL